ncbi:MAG: PAS domain S-box protein [Bacteroidota bacterium]|nr:PAS domain S-box protein [Bacteroidota bacterium]
MDINPQPNNLDSLIRLCFSFLKVPFAIVAIKTSQKEWQISEYGISGFDDQCLHLEHGEAKNLYETSNIASISTNKFFSNNNIKFYAQVPLVNNGKNIGYLCAMGNTENALAKNEQAFLKIIAENISALVSSKSELEKLEEQVLVLNYFLTGSSKIMAVINSETFVFESANEEFYQLTGFRFDNEVESSFIDIISPAHQAHAEEELKGINEGNFIEFEVTTINLSMIFLRIKALKKGNKTYIHAKDITEKKKLKQELVENEERYRRLSEFAFENIAIHELGKIVDCNLAFTKTFGYDYSEVKGMSLFNFFPRIYREISNKDSSLIGERRLETMCVRNDSSTFPAEIMIKTIVNDGLTINAIAIRDNTERKELENELVKSTVFQRAILDSSSFAIISIDFNGLIKTFNKGAEKMLGVKAEDVVEKLNIVALHVQEEIGHRAEALSIELNKTVLPGFEVFIEKLQTLNVDESEWTYPQKDNPAIIASVTATTLKDNFGEITGYLFMATDISDKKKAEAEIIDKSQLLNGILSHMPVFIFKVDKKGFFTQSIGTGLYSLGFEDDKLVGMNIFDTFPQVSDFIEKAYEGEYVSFINSSNISETDFHYEYFVFPDQANTGGLIGFALNITDKINSEQKLKDSADNLEKINKELDQFAYIVSHDLKAPLRGIAALSEYIEEDLGEGADSEVRHNMAMLRGRAQRMQNLIDGILSYSRVGRIKVTRDEINLNNLIQEVISVINAPENFSLSVSKQLPVIYSNSTWLEQIFTNLISNAIKYHDKPQGKVIIDFEEDSKNYKFSVEDDGPGIPEEFHEKVFVIFQTLVSRDTKESTGVGLAIVKKIIEEHGGTIWVESDGKLGSKFIFTLPKM